MHTPECARIAHCTHLNVHGVLSISFRYPAPSWVVSLIATEQPSNRTAGSVRPTVRKQNSSTNDRTHPRMLEALLTFTCKLVFARMDSYACTQPCGHAVLRTANQSERAQLQSLQLPSSREAPHHMTGLPLGWCLWRTDRSWQRRCALRRRWRCSYDGQGQCPCKREERTREITTEGERAL
jgi:hypothetical protein